MPAPNRYVNQNLQIPFPYFAFQSSKRNRIPGSRDGNCRGLDGIILFRVVDGLGMMIGEPGAISYWAQNNSIACPMRIRTVKPTEAVIHSSRQMETLLTTDPPETY